MRRQDGRLMDRSASLVPPMQRLLAGAFVLSALSVSPAPGGARVELVPITPPPYVPNQEVQIEVYLVDTGNPQGNIQFRGIFLDVTDSSGTFSDGCIEWINPFAIDGCGCWCWPHSSWVYPLPTPNPLFQITLLDNGIVQIATITVNLGESGGVLDVMNRDNPDANFGARADFGFGGPGDPITTWRAYTGELTGGWIDLRIGSDVPKRIVASEPPFDAIDARQPVHPLTQEEYGWQSIDLIFDGDILTPQTEDFFLTEIYQGFVWPRPGIASIQPVAPQTFRVVFDERITPGAWLRIRHLPSGSGGRLGYLPGDVDGNGVSNPTDILKLIDALNGVIVRPIWSTDIDRSGMTNPADILREIDLLNGAGIFSVWNGERLE